MIKKSTGKCKETPMARASKNQYSLATPSNKNSSIFPLRTQTSQMITTEAKEECLAGLRREYRVFIRKELSQANHS